jgi:ABC-type uncharacterized transport system ATPase component
LAEPIEQHIIDKIKHASELYYRLILVVATAGAGKTHALQGVKESTGAPMVNVNLELSRRLLDLTERQRALQVPRLLDEILAQTCSDIILLDNIEILFDIALKQDPLRLLQGLSRNRTVVAAWNGSISKGNIIYAVPEHPEYRKYQVRDFLVVSPMAATQEQTKG